MGDETTPSIMRRRKSFIINFLNAHAKVSVILHFANANEHQRPLTVTPFDALFLDAGEGVSRIKGFIGFKSSFISSSSCSPAIPSLFV